MTLDTLKSKLMLLFSASNSALIEACKIVVDGYKGDGMENMHNRDDVFMNIVNVRWIDIPYKKNLVIWLINMFAYK